MLNGQVFSEQTFKNEMYALIMDKILSGQNGVIHDYKNEMEVSYSGNNVTISSGSIIIQGRQLNEDSSTTINAGTDSLYCKLVIEIDLDKTNTENDFQQGYYKIVTGVSAYPALTQTDILNNNSGVYQYELARFKTSSNGIIDFQDMRTYIEIGTEYKKKNEFHVYTSARASGSNSPIIDAQLPDGWTVANCVVISVEIGTDVSQSATSPEDLNIRWQTPNLLSEYSVAYNVWLQGGRIGITTQLNSYDGADFLKAVIMKIS